MSIKHVRPEGKVLVSVYLDNNTHDILLSSKNRSGRTKSAEIAMRLKDHFRRFPNYIFSEKDDGEGKE